MISERRNEPRSRTAIHDETGTWYILDNAATIIPSVTDAVETKLFRLSATLAEDIDAGILQSALDAVVARFPYFAVEFRHGLFWHYLAPCNSRILLVDDAISPSQDYDVNKRGTCLFRVRVGGRRIACEFHHSLTDGTGGMRFLKNLLAEYCRRAAPPSAGASNRRPAAWEDDPDLYALEDSPAPEEYEDAYNRHYREAIPAPDRVRPAFRLRSPPLPRHEYRTICGLIPLAEALATAKGFGASLTEFLAATYIDALQTIWLSQTAANQPTERDHAARPNLVVSVPVNMRRLFPSATNRNFSLFAFVSQDMRLGRRDFREIVERARLQLRFETDAKTMGRQLSRNVSASNSIFFRAMPLPLKTLVFRLFYHLFGENLYTAGLSNLGAASLPPGLEARVERFDFVPMPTREKTEVSMISWRGILHVTFGSLGSSRELERLFFTRLRKLGLRVRIECNLEER
jgi:hypothetical protein